MLTLDDWDVLPEDLCRCAELVNGHLVWCPPNTASHQAAVVKLVARLDEELPREWMAIHRVDVAVNPVHPPTVRAPDVVVVPTARYEDGVWRFEADDVVLAVEVVSADTANTDRVTKFAEYARAGIPHYWLVELDEPVTLAAYCLVDGSYECIEGGNGKVEVTRPAPMSFDLDTLGRLR